jgi:hypothetical protein
MSTGERPSGALCILGRKVVLPGSLHDHSLAFPLVLQHEAFEDLE